MDLKKDFNRAVSKLFWAWPKSELWTPCDTSLKQRM